MPSLIPDATTWLPAMTGVLFALAAFLAFLGALAVAREAGEDHRRRRIGAPATPSRHGTAMLQGWAARRDRR